MTKNTNTITKKNYCFIKYKNKKKIYNLNKYFNIDIYN